MQILHETMSMPMVVKRIAGKIGSVRRSTVAIQNDYKTLKQATGTMIPLVYVGSCNSDLIGFTYKMKKIKAEVDTT